MIAAVPLGSNARAADQSAASLYTLAQQAEGERRDDRAAALYEEAHHADPFDPAPLNALGRLAVRIGATDQAMVYFEAALAIERRDRAARQGLADVYVELDRAEEALLLYDALLAEDGSDGQAWNGKGLALDLAGRHDDAQAAYRAGLAVAPENHELRANLGLSQALASAPAEQAPGTDGVAVALNDQPIAVTTAPAAPLPPATRDP